MRKRLLASLLSLAMLLTMLPVTAFASETVDPTFTLTYDSYTFTTTETEIQVPKGSTWTSIEGLATGTEVYLKGTTENAEAAKVGTTTAEGGIDFTDNSKSVSSLTDTAGNVITFKKSEEGATALLTLTVVDPAAAPDLSGATEIKNKLMNSALPSANKGTITLTAKTDLNGGCVRVGPGQSMTLDIGANELTSSSGVYTVRVVGAKDAETEAVTRGVLTITGDGGTITNTSTGSTTICADIYSTLTIEGTPKITYLENRTAANGFSAIKGDEYSEIIINGHSEIEGAARQNGTPIALQAYGKVAISDGVFTGLVRACAESTYNGTFEISGGTFESLATWTDTDAPAATIEISGGSFKTNPCPGTADADKNITAPGKVFVEEGEEGSKLFVVKTLIASPAALTLVDAGTTLTPETTLPEASTTESGVELADGATKWFKVTQTASDPVTESLTEVPAENDTFAKAGKYRAQITVAAESGYEFETDQEFEVDGESAEASREEGSSDYVVTTKDYTITDTVESVEFAFTTPAEGETIPTSATVTADPEGSVAAQAPITWTKFVDNEGTESETEVKGGNFEAAEYKATIKVTPEEYYSFATNATFEFNGDAAVETKSESDGGMTLSKTYNLSAEPPKVKSAVTIAQPDEGGTVKVAYKDENESPVETQADTSIAEGTDVTVTATPSSEEYTFDKITVTHVLGEGNESAEELTSSPETFTMPAHPVKISASFNPTSAGTPRVTVTADGKPATPTANGSAVEIDNVAANVTTATVTIENAEGYAVEINGESQSEPYTVDLADTGDTTITITLTKDEETLTYKVIVKKASSVDPGTDEISEVNVALVIPGSLVVGDGLINATTSTANVTVKDTKWYEGESETAETSGTFSKAGTYKAVVTLTPNDGKTFKTDAEVTLNNKALESNVQVTKDTNEIVLTISGISVSDKSDPSVTTTVTAVNVTLDIPETLEVGAALIPATATGGVKVTTTEWFLEDSETPVETTFSEAGTYRAVVTMEADNGYQILADTAVVTLNNETFTDEVATVEQKDGQIVLTRKNVPVNDKPAVPHLITVEPSEGGSVSADLQEAVKDTEITITVEPNEGMELASLTVAAGDEILVVKDNKFTMPDTDVIITATFNAQPVVEAPAVEAEPPTIGDDNKAEVVIENVTPEAISQAIEDAKQAAESDDEAKPTVSMGTAEVAEGSEITTDTASAISIPMDIVTAVADEALNQVALEAVTPIGSVTVPAYGVKNLVEQATESGSEEDNITIRLDIEPTNIGAESEADPIVAYNVEFKKVAADGTETHLDMDTAVFLKLWTPLIPRDPDKGLTVLLIDDTDKSRKVIKKEAIPSGGMVGFLAPHLSIYATTDALNAELAGLDEVDVEPAPDVTPDPVEWVRLGKKQNNSFGTIIIDGKKDCTYRVEITRGKALGAPTTYYVVEAAADGELELTVTNQDIITIYEYGPGDKVYSEWAFADPATGREAVTLTIDLGAYTD